MRNKIIKLISTALLLCSGNLAYTQSTGAKVEVKKDVKAAPEKKKLQK